MILNETMVKAIKLVIEELKCLIESDQTAFICYAIRGVIFERQSELDADTINALEELSKYILKGIDGHTALSAWLLFVTNESCSYDLSEIRDAARLCWLERLVYFASLDWKSVNDDGLMLTALTPFKPYFSKTFTF